MDGAADAAVVHLEDFFLGSDDEVVVDTDFAELVDNNRDSVAVRGSQDAVQERCFTSTQEARKYYDGYFIHGRVVHSVGWFDGYTHPSMSSLAVRAKAAFLSSTSPSCSSTTIST